MFNFKSRFIIYGLSRNDSRPTVLFSMHLRVLDRICLTRLPLSIPAERITIGMPLRLSVREMNNGHIIYTFREE